MNKAQNPASRSRPLIWGIWLLLLLFSLTSSLLTNSIPVSLLATYIIISTIPLFIQLTEGSIQIFRPDMIVAGTFLIYTIPVPVNVLFLNNSQSISIENMQTVLL